LQFASVFCIEIAVEKHFDHPKCDFWRGLKKKFSGLAIARHILRPPHKLCCRPNSTTAYNLLEYLYLLHLAVNSTHGQQLVSQFLPRIAMCKRGICCRPESVRLYVCPSNTLLHCIQTAKDRDGLKAVLSRQRQRSMQRGRGTGEARQQCP